MPNGQLVHVCTCITQNKSRVSMNFKFSTIQKPDINSLLLQIRVPATGVSCQFCIVRVSKWIIVSLFPRPVPLANIFTLLYLLHRWLLFFIFFLFFLWRCGPTRAMVSSFLRFLDHTQRRTTVSRTPLDE